MVDSGNFAASIGRIVAGGRDSGKVAGDILGWAYPVKFVSASLGGRIRGLMGGAF